MTTTELIEAMVARIVERFHPQKNILFGSHARGDALSDSDIDLMVVMPIEGVRRSRQVEIRLALRDFGAPKDIVVVTPEELELYRDVVGSIVEPAVRGGKVMYAEAS